MEVVSSAELGEQSAAGRVQQSNHNRVETAKMKAGATVLLIGAVLGVLLLVAARFFLQPPQQAVHYHANWAIFVDGRRVDLTADRYMEDVGRCAADPALQRPEDRIHMHEANHDIVHVHSSGTTWGHLLANIGFGVGDDYLQLQDSLLRADSTRTLKFVLNGSRVRSIRNLPVRNEDRLLISFGRETLEEVTASQFPSVASTAAEYNTRPDPASCSGATEENPTARLRRAVGF